MLSDPDANTIGSSNRSDTPSASSSPGDRAVGCSERPALPSSFAEGSFYRAVVVMARTPPMNRLAVDRRAIIVLATVRVDRPARTRVSLRQRNRDGHTVACSRQTGRLIRETDRMRVTPTSEGDRGARVDARGCQHSCDDRGALDRQPELWSESSARRPATDGTGCSHPC